MKRIRTILTTLMVAAPLLIGGSTANASAGWTSYDTDVVVPGCPGFDVRIQAAGRNRIEFGEVITIKSARTHTIYTNVVTGNSVRLSGNANLSATLNGDGTITVNAKGSIDIGGPAIGLVSVHGQVKYVVNEAAGWTESYELLNGRTTDICTLID